MTEAGHPLRRDPFAPEPFPWTPHPKMMQSRHFAALFAVVLGVCTFSSAAAQLHRPLSVEASVGLGSAVGGPQARYRTGASVDALVAVRLGTVPGGSFVLGVAAGVQGAPARTDVCVVAPGRECVPEFPIFSSIGPVAGWENSGGTLRLLAGVASFQSDDGDGVLGVNARVDLSTRPWKRLAPVVSLRTSLLPSYQGEMVGLGGVGIGLCIR